MSSGRSLRLTQYRSDSQKLQEFTQKFETQQINSSEAVYMTQDIQSIAIENPVLNAVSLLYCIFTWHADNKLVNGSFVVYGKYERNECADSKI